ncbi:MAG: ribonuclease HI family protein [Candidatus Omnitrophica bacterium]|nr:ribonuclease HI family protein [Candidatus Omnitrophota bacterium]
MIVYIDGASRGNPGQAGIGIAVYDGNKKPVRQFGYYLGTLTNNMAEYMAAIFAVMVLLELGAKSVTIHSDSELLIRQLKGEYRVKNEKLLPLYLQIKFFLRSFEKVNFVHIRREKNKIADRLANRAIDEKGYVNE